MEIENNRGKSVNWLGKSSVASILVRVLDFVWYLCLVGIVLCVYVSISYSIIGNQPSDNLKYTPPTKIADFDLGNLKIELDKPVKVPLLRIVANILVGITSLTIIYLLRRIFKTLNGDNPFVKQNISRIRWIGINVIICSIFNSIQKIIDVSLIEDLVVVKGGKTLINFGLDFNIIFLGLVILVLAEIFKIATEIKEENNLTV